MKLLWCLLLLAWYPGSGVADEWTFRGVVTKVHDGDSLWIGRNSTKRVIRLNGVDSPELNQNWGIAARDILRSAILDKEVVARCHKKDKYDRNVCVVYYQGIDINLQLVANGLSWWYEAFASEQSLSDRNAYAAAQAKARSEKIGLWSEEHTAPWVFRKLSK